MEKILDVESGFGCTSCDWAAEDDADCEPKYECGSCGTEFLRSESSDGDSNRCPDCNKFGSKLYLACPECEDETQTMDIVHCPICDDPLQPSYAQDHVWTCGG
jgi:DNA-directed RNA polymerase subunit RPC12/RpoP